MPIAPRCSNNPGFSVVRFEQPRVFSGQVPVGESVMHMDRVVNGSAEMLAAVRQNLKEGASQIKLALGGGVYSLYDPLDVT